MHRLCQFIPCTVHAISYSHMCITFTNRLLTIVDNSTCNSCTAVCALVQMLQEIIARLQILHVSKMWITFYPSWRAKALGVEFLPTRAHIPTRTYLRGRTPIYLRACMHTCQRSRTHAREGTCTHARHRRTHTRHECTHRCDVWCRPKHATQTPMIMWHDSPQLQVQNRATHGLAGLSYRLSLTLVHPTLILITQHTNGSNHGRFTLHTRRKEVTSQATEAGVGWPSSSTTATSRWPDGGTTCQTVEDPSWHYLQMGGRLCQARLREMSRHLGNTQASYGGTLCSTQYKGMGQGYG